jgi:uncharacterized protein (DUF2236 family)
MTLLAGTDSIRKVGAQTVRRQLRGAVQRVLTGADETRRRPKVLQSQDPGLFGPDSVTWKVHGDASMLIGGLRALLLQTMHPLAMAGIADHSQYRTDPFGRLQRTGSYVGTVTFGSVAEVDAAIAAVRRGHERVTGTAADGRPYAANDPDLLAWVHHTLVDSFLRAYQRYGPVPLDAAQADRYVAEQAELARRIGASPPATSTAELRSWMIGRRPELVSTRAAREACRFLVFFRGPPLMTGPYAIVSAASVGLLPGFVRRALWLPVVPLASPLADHLLVRPTAGAMTRALGWVMKDDHVEST